MRVSYTYLNLMACPYANFLRYEGGIKTTITHYLALGNAVHLALEKIYEQRTDPQFFTRFYVINKTVDEAIKIFLDEFNRSIEEDEVFVTYPALKKAQAEGAEEIARYYAQVESGKFPNPVIGVEQEFKLPIEGIEIVGKIDKVEQSPEGLIVIDYKTGSKKPDDWFLRRNLQFTAYYWAVHEIYGEWPIKVGWHHLRSGEVLYQERELWDVEQLQRTVRNVARMKDQDIRHRVYSQAVCDWCEYKGHGNQCDDKELEQKILEKRNALRS